mgnify:CR=1 FL=1
MNIFGIGTDIVSVVRIKNSLKNKSFINRIFNKKEISKCKNIKNRINCYAKRFAAKEAFSKSLGTGFRNNLNFRDIVIKNNKSGKPFFFITKKIKSLINKQFKTKKFNFYLSISDEKNYSVAFVIFQK